jgi:N-acetylglucosaminyldiphosphoundecaprenol N-acetyl-beta-D-mannosaminyltransferase
VQACRERGLSVRQGYLQDLPTAQPFHVVAMFHVLEHSLDPSGLLSDIRERMAAGGYLFIEVPNIRGSWQGLGMLHIAHPYQYSGKTLAALAEKAGFSVVERVEIEELGFESSVRVVARKEHSSENSKLPLPADDPAELAALFAERLTGWKRDLARFRMKRSLLRVLGPGVTRTLRGSLAKLRLRK